METDREVTILIIDDNQANIFALERILEGPGVNLVSAVSGRAGLKFALEIDIDLVILDVQMPEMDGFEVAQVLKSHKRTKDIPIIFASAEKKERQSVMKGFEEGAFDYLAKPLDPEVTRAKVAVLLKIQMQKKELIEKNLALQHAEVEINRLNVDLQRNLLQLESTNKELESFSYSVSHDLRAPLRAIIGYTRILEEEANSLLNKEGHHALKTIGLNAIRMNQLIDDLLEFSRSLKKEVRTSVVDMADLVESSLRELQVTYPNVIVRKNDIFEAHADKALITQVWINLIANACKYSSKSNSPAIEIGSEKGESEMIYYVKDNGVGFDMKYADKLFGVFQRLHKVNEFEGVGIGLALVHRIISRHGGRVWAEGKLGEGATFYFSLPSKMEPDL